MAYIGTSPSNGVRRVHTYTATASQTTFSGASSEGVTLSYADTNYLDVFQNGILLGSADYTSTSGTSVVLAQGASADDLIVIVVYDVFSVADTVSKANGGTFDGNVTMAGTLGVTGETTLATHLNLGDSDKIKLGDSGDLEIYHDGSNSYVDDTGTGDLRLRGNDQVRIQKYTGENMITCNVDDGVQLYHDNVEKFVTNSTGINVNNKIQGASGESLTLESQSGGAVIFNTNGANERMRITSAGYIDIGTINHSSTSMLDIASPNLAGTAATISLQNNTDNTGGYFVAFYRSNNNLIGNISQGSGSVAYNTTSDHRLKENVTYDFDATTRLKQLKPCRFNFTAYADTTVDGFLAHEVQSVVPEAITGTHNEVEVWKEGEELPDGVSVGDNKLDDDGNTTPVYQGIDQSKLVPLLVKTIQELEARITALENAE